MRYQFLSFVAFLTVLLLPFSASAQDASPSTERRIWQFASGPGNVLFLGLGLTRPLLTDGNRGGERFGRTADALAVSSALTLGLKKLTREERPDHSNRESFPSGHASAAFTIATMESHFHRKEAPLWFLGATLIGASRVPLRRHHVHDVLAGAALGYLTARLELAQPNGLITGPFIHRDQTGRWVSFKIQL